MKTQAGIITLVTSTVPETTITQHETESCRAMFSPYEWTQITRGGVAWRGDQAFFDLEHIIEKVICDSAEQRDDLPSGTRGGGS